MDPNQEEIPDLLEKEFRRSVIKLIREAPEKGEVQFKEIKNMKQEMRGEIFSEIDSINKKQSKLQEIINTVRESKMFWKVSGIESNKQKKELQSSKTRFSN